jgi:hypothetical protein
MSSINSRGILKKCHRVSEEVGSGLASATGVERGLPVDFGIVSVLRDQNEESISNAKDKWEWQFPTL